MGSLSAQVYTGLVGLLAIGRTDGNLPLVTEKNIPIRNMALQYNFVFDRAGGLAQLNNPTWPQWVSTITPPKADELANGTYRPSLAPVNFNRSKPGTKYLTVWYAGPLSIHKRRGRLQFIPSNLQRFTAADGKADSDVPADPSLPDYKRDVQFTVNGQFQPVIKSKAGQTEIWVLANVSDFAYMNVQLTETATGRHPPIAIVGQDGNPYTTVHYPPTDNGTRLLIPPASRFAIAVTIPAEGELVLEMPERGGGAKTISAPGVLYTNNGTDNPPAVLGSLSVLPSAVSYADGFFVFPTQVLARATPSRRWRRDDRLRRRSAARCLHGLCRPRQHDAGRQAADPDLRRISQQHGEHRGPESVRLCIRRRRISQRAADPAAAQLGRGVEVRQPQQRRASDPRPRQ